MSQLNSKDAQQRITARRTAYRRVAQLLTAFLAEVSPADQVTDDERAEFERIRAAMSAAAEPR